MLRIERLPDAAQELLRLLAVGGRLDHDLLADAAGLGARELRESLRAAVAGHLVVVDVDGGYAFRHALLREVVQDDLLPGEGMELHRALAQALERRAAAGDTSVAISAAIASHHLAAGDRRDALAASVRAAAAAEAVRAPGEAAALLERALELWDRVPDAEAVAGLDHVDLLWRAAEAHNLGGQRSRAEPLMRAALEQVDAAAEPRRAAKLMARLARFLWHLNRAGEALDTLRAGDRLLPPGEDSPERAALLGMWARGRMFQGRTREAVERAREAKRVAEACGDTASLGVALNVLGTSLIALGEIEEGTAALRRAGEIAVERDDPLEIDAAACNLADALHAAGRSREALEAARRGAGELAASPNTHQWLTLMTGRDRLRPRRLGGGGPHAARRGAPLRRPHAAQRRAAPAPPGAGPRRPRPGRRAAGAACVPPSMRRPSRSSSRRSARSRPSCCGARATWTAPVWPSRRCSSGSGTVPRTSHVSAAWPAPAWRSRPTPRSGRATSATRAAPSVRSAGCAACWSASGRLPRRAGRSSAPSSPRPRPMRPARSGVADPALSARAAAAWEAVERPYPAALARWREAEAHLAREDRDAAADAGRAALETARRLGAGWLAGEVESLASRGRLRLERRPRGARPGRGAG